MRHLCVALTLALLAMAGFGCESQERTTGLSEPVVGPAEQDSLAQSNERISDADVLGDMSPALMTRPKTPGEVDIDIARTVDTNGRSAWRDLMRVLLLDKPSHLSPYPTP